MVVIICVPCTAASRHRSSCLVRTIELNEWNDEMRKGVIFVTFSKG